MAKDKIVILTGAGISAESGLETFRDAGGLWAQHRIEDVATPDAFQRNPERVHGFYNARRKQARGVSPNAAHDALTRLQSDARFDVVIVTQNVDGLHEMAGSRVIHMHGALDSALCASCDARWPAPEAMHVADPCPACGQPCTRPDIVWFGEIPYHMEEIAAHLAECRIFAAIGTSGQVYPAAGFVQEAVLHGAETVEINLAQSDTTGYFDTCLEGPATQTVPLWVDRLIGA